MKKLLSLLVLFPLLLPANPVSRGEAESSALRFLQERGISGSVLTVSKSHGARKSQAADGVCPYYVFDYGQGIVIASADDRLPAVLGYTTSPNKHADLPPALEAWLEDYEAYTALLDKHPEEAQQQHAPQRRRQEITPSPDHAPVEPFITTQWYQREPYNLTCPVYPNLDKRSITGCVATAMAQAMSRYRYPSHTIKAIPQYSYTNDYLDEDISVTVPGLPNNLFIDWDNMLDLYDDEHPHSPVEDTAVANLMMYVGKSVKMMYSPGSSGAYSINVASALRNYFGYASTVMHHQRETFSSAEWDELIYNEIAHNRPVVYHGSTTTGGHAYVVDGYESEGYYHINWGWGGSYDGYFLLDVLNPRNNDKLGASSTREGYVQSSGAIIGIDTVETELAQPRLMVSIKEFADDSLYYSSRNYTTIPTHFDIGIALLDENANIISILDSHSDINYKSTSYLSHGFALNLQDAEPGYYNIGFVSRITGTEQWILSENVNYNGAIVLLYIDENGKRWWYNYIPNIKIQDINVIGSHQSDSLHTIDVLIRNIGCGTYVNPLYLHYRSEDGLDVDTVSQTVWMEVDYTEERWVHLGFTPKRWGTYKLYIQTEKDPLPRQILDSLEIDIEMPTRASVTVDSKTTFYPTLQQAVDYAVKKRNSTVKLLGNIHMAEDTLQIRSKLREHHMELDLNGFTIDGKVPTLLYMRPSYSSSSLDIVDNSEAQTGKITTVADHNGVMKTVYLYRGTINLKSGTIEVKNQLFYYGSHKGVKAAAVYVRPDCNFNMTGGALNAYSTRYTYGIDTYGNVNITGGRIKAEDTAFGRAYGLNVLGGTTRVSGSPVIEVKASIYAIGARVGGAKPSTAGRLYHGELIVDGGTFNVNATSKAFGVSVINNHRGELVDAGSVVINDGQFNVSVQRSTAYGVYLRKALQVNDNVAVPQAVIRGGHFMITGVSGLRPVNTYAAPDALTLEGGVFNRSNYLSRYTAPTKECNFKLVKLSKNEEDYLNGYRYKIVEIPGLTPEQAPVRTITETEDESMVRPASEISTQKILRDGQLYILYEGRMYDVQGRRVK